jgi:drug/metabolite transporter (DMT)-like permease
MPTVWRGPQGDPKRATATVMEGVVLAAVAFFLFPGHDALVKWLVVGHSVWTILFFRSLVVLTACAVAGRGTMIRRMAETPYKRPLVVRALLLLGAWICFYTASADLQLAELTTIYFGSPVIVTILAVPLLGERVSGLQWIAVVIGFLGVVVACDPSGVSFSHATLLALAAAILWSFTLILLRRSALGAGTFMQIVFTNAIYLPITGIGAVLTWTPLDWPTIGLLVATGIVGGLAQTFSFEAIRRAPASVLAPVEYSALIWSFVLGYLVWNDVPEPRVFVGAALILTGGALVILHLRRHARG